MDEANYLVPVLPPIKAKKPFKLSVMSYERSARFSGAPSTDLVDGGEEGGDEPCAASGG